jgi:hypothetical protein
MSRLPWVVFQALILVGGAMVAASGQQLSASAAKVEVWQWFEGCQPEKQMRVNVLLHGKSLYSAAFPACRMRRGEIPDESPQKVLVFSFQGSAGLFGAEFRRLGTRDIEGNIWRAGGEPDAILLGVSFATPDQILLNSIHIATARKASRSALARGLIIATSPVQPK